MSDDRKNIKLPKDVWEQLKEDKGEYETWAHYLRRRCLGND